MPKDMERKKLGNKIKILWKNYNNNFDYKI